MLWSGVAVLLGLLATGVILYFFLVRSVTAVVMITPKKNTITAQSTLTVDEDAREPDLESMTLPGILVEKAVSGSESTTASGTTTVGDKATGSITLLNSTESEKTFAAGTTVSGNGQSFTLDSAVSVPAATRKDTSVTTTEIKKGEASATVTATEIGDGGNLGEDVQLQVADFASNTYEAVTQSAFSGGSSREITVVAEQDLTALRTTLEKQLLETGGGQLADEQSAGVYVLPGYSLTVSSAQYSAEVGDETREITLTMQGTVQALSYRAEDLKPLAHQLLISQVPEGFQLSDDDPQILSSPTDAQEEISTSTRTLEANITTTAVATISSEDIKTSIAGKRASEAESQLSSTMGITSAQLELRPVLATRFGIGVPSDTQKIEILFE
ncbi:hypothetical protein KC686_00750 [Candidatus Woesebacteria bacterium]|nr:hypothetical protein [Candidatus Woesebacteria bacterium]